MTNMDVKKGTELNILTSFQKISLSGTEGLGKWSLPPNCILVNQRWIVKNGILCRLELELEWVLHTWWPDKKPSYWCLQAKVISKGRKWLTSHSGTPAQKGLFHGSALCCYSFTVLNPFLTEGPVFSSYTCPAMMSSGWYLSFLIITGSKPDTSCFLDCFVTFQTVPRRLC